MIVVLDASAAVEVILQRERAPDIEQALAEADLVISPDLYVAEESNAIWTYAEADGGRLNALELLGDAISLPDKFVASEELYREALSFSIKMHDEEESWWQGEAPTVFAPFAKDTDYFGRAEQAWMNNVRIRDRDAMVTQPRNHQIKVDVDSELYPNGRFARL